MLAVSVNGLRKSYAESEAVKGISFDVNEGDFFAFLGPNGAGKSTTISIICSLLKYDSGSVRIFGKDPIDAKMDIGVVFQDHMLDPNLTVEENISLKGAMYGLKGDELKKSTDRVLGLVDAIDIRDRRYGRLSGGQKRRVDIARALIHDPKMLVLDEPTSGLDPQSRKSLWDTIFDLNKRSGMTIFLTTHYMEEATYADDIVIIKDGTIIAHGTPERLKEEHCTDYIKTVPKDRDALTARLDSMDVGYTINKDTIIIPINTSFDSLPIIESVKDLLTSFEVRTGTLDDAFIDITRGDPYE